MRTPIAFPAFCTTTARSGISMYFSVVSVTSKPLATPACASSCFALAMSILRCGAPASDDGNTGANGLSLPSCALPRNRPRTITSRSSESAMAWRTRLHGDRLELGVVHEARAALHGERAHHVSLTSLQRENLRLFVGVERKL